jgi:hypothetical protein
MKYILMRNMERLETARKIFERITPETDFLTLQVHMDMSVLMPMRNYFRQFYDANASSST